MPDSSVFVVPFATPTTGGLVDVNALVARFRKNVLDEPYEDYSTASVDASLTTTAISVNAPTMWKEGDIMEPRDYNTGFELYKVRVGGANPITVKRAHNDSTPGTHVSGVTLLKNPRFSGDEIEEGLTRICYDMWPQAWRTVTVQINPISGVTTYALPADVLDLVNVTQDTTPVGTTLPSVTYYGKQNSGRPILVQRDVPSTISNTGLALYVPAIASFTVPLNVTYRALIDIGSVDEGLMADTVVLGAVSRVLGVRQVVRSGQDLRQAEPGMASIYMQDLGYFQSEYMRLLRRLYLQLMASSPPDPLWRI